MKFKLNYKFWSTFLLASGSCLTATVLLALPTILIVEHFKPLPALTLKQAKKLAQQKLQAIKPNIKLLPGALLPLASYQHYIDLCRKSQIWVNQVVSMTSLNQKFKAKLAHVQSACATYEKALSQANRQFLLAGREN